MNTSTQAGRDQIATPTNEDTMETITARLKVKEVTLTQGVIRFVRLEWEGFDVPEDMEEAEYQRLDRLHNGFSFSREPIIETEAPLEPNQIVELSLRVIGTA